MVELRAQIRSLESSSWYKGSKETAKLAGATGGNLPASGEKWCSGCQRSTHNTVDCYGICRWCNGRGHRAENCRFKKDAEAKEEQLKASKAAEIKKKKKPNPKMQKRREMKVPTKLPLLWTYRGQLEQLLFQILHLRKKDPHFWRQVLGAKE